MTQSHTIGVIIAAAGAGERLGGGRPKQWRLLNGMSLVERAWRSFLPTSLSAAGQHHLPRHIVVVSDDESQILNSPVADPALIRTARGGTSRTESVRHGLRVLPSECDLIVVHDAARPFWPQNRWDRLIEEASRAGGAILSVPVADTIKRADGQQCTTVDRRHLWAAQTPQAFRGNLLREAHARAEHDAYAATDDAELVERSGGSVALVESTRNNFKITTPEDWEQAEQMAMTGMSSARIGLGYDAHRLGGDGPLKLGGVILADTGGLIGHSDGDVLLHAICDAILGAAALGDIGRHFPPGEKEYAGIDSRKLVQRTRDIVLNHGFRVQQVDAVVIAEAPRLAPHIETMRGAIAADLGIEPGMVSVKATTTEKMGFVGRGEGIAAQAIAVVIPALSLSGEGSR